MPTCLCLSCGRSQYRNILNAQSSHHLINSYHFWLTLFFGRFVNELYNSFYYKDMSVKLENTLLVKFKNGLFSISPLMKILTTSFRIFLWLFVQTVSLSIYLKGILKSIEKKFYFFRVKNQILRTSAESGQIMFLPLEIKSMQFKYTFSGLTLICKYRCTAHTYRCPLFEGLEQ